MADNVTIPATGTGSATPIIATDDVGGAQYQRVKLDIGGDGASQALSGNTGTVDAGTLRVTLATDVAVPVSDNGGALTVDGTVAVTNAGLTELAAAINASSQMDVNLAANGIGIATEATLAGVLTSANFAAAFGTAGTADSQVLSVQGIASMTPVQVSQATASNLNATVVGTGTFAAQVTAVGTVADDGTTPGAPVMVGGFAISPDGTDPGSVSAEADVARFRTDLNRRLLTNPVHPRQLHKHLDGTTAYTDESVVADPGDGFQTVITNIIASNGEAVAINFFLEEGSTKIFGPIYLPAVAGSGFCSGPIYLPVTASTAVTLTSSAGNDQAFDIDYFIQAV